MELDTPNNSDDGTDDGTLSSVEPDDDSLSDYDKEVSIEDREISEKDLGPSTSKLQSDLVNYYVY